MNDVLKDQNYKQFLADLPIDKQSTDGNRKPFEVIDSPPDNSFSNKKSLILNKEQLLNLKQSMSIHETNDVVKIHNFINKKSVIQRQNFSEFRQNAKLDDHVQEFKVKNIQRFKKKQ